MWILKSLEVRNIISFKNVTFIFRNSKAVVLIGSNLDDSSQKGNGSGKSSLIESIALAFSGSSIRDVKTKELIYNEEKDGELTLILSNSQLNQELVVWRKLYANTKSAEYKAWLGGVDQKAKYSDFNSFNTWVWNTIGISKEDFFSFYLITSDDYEPFLKVGDVKKKEIINRFSGADKVDVVFPKIEQDASVINEKVVVEEKLLLSNTTKQEVLTQQLLDAENEVSEETRNNLIEQKKNDLSILIAEAGNSSIPTEEVIKEFQEAVRVANKNVTDHEAGKEERLSVFKDELELANLEVDAFELTKDFDKLIENKNVDINFKKEQVKIKIEAIGRVKDSFADEIKSIKEEEDKLKADINAQGIELRENEEFESEVNKNLLDSIECPKCKHKFLLRDQEFNVEEARAALPEVVQTIANIKIKIEELKTSLNTKIPEKKEAVNNKILEAGAKIRTEITGIQAEISELGTDVHKLANERALELQSKQKLINAANDAKTKLSNAESNELNTLTTLKNQVRRCELNLQQKQNELNAHLENIKHLEEQIAKLQNQEVDKTKINSLTTDLEKLIIEEGEINDRLELLRKEKEGVSAWELNFTSFKSYLANKSIKNIEDFSNLYLQGMGSNLQIRIDGYKTLSNKKISEKITTSVLRDGFDAGSYGKFSGGERSRIDISVIIGIQELINLNSKHGGMDFLCCDEILDQVDATGLESIINSLQSLQRTIMIVSQNDIQTLSDQTIIIQKQNKVSTILN